jgi:acyl-CoA synthetase (AMP-forming)/AMP-acid ligase II
VLLSQKLSVQTLFSSTSSHFFLKVNERLESKRTNGLRLFILQGYGLTETSPTTHIQPWTGSHKIGSIGLLLPNLEARLVVDDSGEIDAEEGQPGELWLRGSSVMKVRRNIYHSLARRVEEHRLQ